MDYNKIMADPLKSYPGYMEGLDYFFLFETGLRDKENFSSYIFTEPVDVIKVNSYRAAGRALRRIDALSRKYWIAGYFSYELGYYFESRQFLPLPKPDYPLMHLCVFENAVLFNHGKGMVNRELREFLERASCGCGYSLGRGRLNMSEKEYLGKVSRLKKHLEQGDTYQVNFTAKYKFDFKGSPFSFYEDLKRQQRVSYAAFCKLRDEYVISLSPELFFRRQHNRITCRPMKGTARRPSKKSLEGEAARKLGSSIKDKAENLMIVDLVRNDLGRICRKASVSAGRMFNVEKYGTLFQMTSTVEGELKPGAEYRRIFGNIFPGGSVTGAPKIKTMKIIRSLEKEPRNIYCGALGFISPAKKAVFNLPIRTISLMEGKAEMGLGSGIVYDSDPKKEFRECLLKAEFLLRTGNSFGLFESMAWDNGYKFLKEHADRMRQSARYFGFDFDRKSFIALANSIARRFEPQRRYKVRILLERGRGLLAGYSQLSRCAHPQEARIILSKTAVDSGNPFLYHKTTNRKVYDEEYKRYRSRGYFDVVFYNQKGEVTEGAISNVIVKIDGRLYTPHLSCGLLPGICRAGLLKKKLASQRVITVEEFLRAEEIYLCNSVRGITRVELEKR